MKSLANLSYNYSGEWDDVCKALRNYPTDLILKRICKEEIEFQKNAPTSEVTGTKWVEYNVFNTRTRDSKKKESVITTWNLIDLAFYAVNASNDFRGKAEISDAEFYVLVDAVVGFTQKREETLLNTIEPGSKEAFMYLWGFAGEQFKVQAPAKVIGNAGRELYILFELAKRVDREFDIPKIVEMETGICWEKIVCSLFLGWVYFSRNCVYNDDALSNVKSELLSKSDFLKVIERYSIDYSGIRSDKSGRQVFYTRPFVITQKKELVSISPYLNLCIYEHCIFWIVRDYYHKQKSQSFIDFFGKCFEEYFKEILENCLGRDEFERIAEGRTPSADWKLEIDGFRFLVEQKSSLIQLNVKQQETNIEALKDFAKKTIIKAIKQLYNSEQTFGDGPYIKIILLYDNYLMPAILEQVFEMDECAFENDGRYWIASIEEMEALLCLCQNQRDTFDAIIAEKEHREMTHSNLGRSLSQIMVDHKVTKNPYLKQDRIVYYQNFAKEQAIKVLKE